MSSHWNKAKLGDIADVITKGTTPRTLGREYCSSGVGFVRAENLQGGWVDLNSIDLFIDEETDSLLARSRILPGDVLITIAGTIGRTGVVPSGAGRLNSNQAVALVRLTQQINPRFLEYWLRTGEGQHQIAGGKVTQNIPNLSLGQIGGLVVPVPDLREQARIVELLDQADALRRQRAEADAKLTRLLPALFRHHFGDTESKLPVSPLGDLVHEFRYGTSIKSGDAGTLTLRIPNVVRGQIDYTNLVRTELSDAELTRITLAEGDVLFVRTNGNREYVGRCASFSAGNVPDEISRESFSFASYLIRARLRTELINPHFLTAFLATEAGRSALLQKANTSAGQYNINIENLSSLAIPTPALRMQNQFCSQLDFIRKCQTQAAASAAKVETLFQTLLHRAFTGELTARWREAHLREGVQELARLSRA